MHATRASEGELRKDELAALVASVWADERKRRFVVELTRTVSWRGARKAGRDNDAFQFAAIDDLGLAGITAATLLVHGRVDRDVRPQHTEFAASRISGAQVEWIERGGHLAAFTAPQSDALQQRMVHLLRP